MTEVESKGSDKESNQLRARPDLNHYVDVPKEKISLGTCVADVWRVIEFLKSMSHGLRYVTQPYRTGAGYSSKIENKTFC